MAIFINTEQFIQEHITRRKDSLFQADIEDHKTELEEKINGKSVLVIGGAGSIGSSYIKAILRFHPGKLFVVDLNENGLTELTRDLRSSWDITVPEVYKTYTLDFADPIFERIFREEGGFDIVANFSAHKHVRSEKDRFTVEAMIRNNIFKAKKLLDLMKEFPPQAFFCVSTDKAANPVNIMGCSKKIMEDLIFSYSRYFKISTARFANVAFSNGSLPAGWIERMNKRQPLAAPSDVKRYFVSPQESGQICMMACMLGQNREIFFPKLGEEKMLTFSSICDAFLKENGLTPHRCDNDDEAKRFAHEMDDHTEEWPVVYFKSDTTGEKDFEEFYIAGEKTDMESFRSLGIIKDIPETDPEKTQEFIENCRDLFETDYTKEEVITLMKNIVPNFVHEEKGKNLDQKM